MPPLGLYVHLPWCERKCPYCDFNSHSADRIPEQRYVDTLLRDLEYDLVLAGNRPVQTLFIGGGTPSLFSPIAINRLLRGIGSLLDLAPGLEATLEANPGSAEAARFAGYREAGINRLSIGVQSFDDRCLQALGRIHDGGQARAAVIAARAAGFADFNLDLMHGLPGQSAAEAAADLASALALEPPHLSWYQLTIEPNTAFYRRPPSLPEEDALAGIQAAGEELLADHGMAQYEVSAYSRPGRRCRHNVNYWTFGDYLGIGAGAHGKVTAADGRITRYAKRRQPEHYLDCLPGTHTAQRRELQAADLAAEFMLNALRLNAGCSTELFTERTGLAPDCLEPTLGRLAARGLLTVDGRGFRTSALGRRFLDTVVAEFLPAGA